jgi:hypothetical protein
MKKATQFSERPEAELYFSLLTNSNKNGGVDAFYRP